MGMTVNYKHISPWLLALFEQQPQLVESFTVSLPLELEPNEIAEKMKEITRMPAHQQKLIQEMLSELDDFYTPEEAMREFIKYTSPENASKILDETKSRGFTLDKMYKAVQFHIAGEVTDQGTSLLSKAVTGGKNIGNDLGYGPATFLPKEDVEKVATELSKISEEDFLNQYSSDNWNKKVAQSALVYFKGLEFYYAEAAKAGHAMLVWGA